MICMPARGLAVRGRFSMFLLYQCKNVPQQNFLNDTIYEFG